MYEKCTMFGHFSLIKKCFVWSCYFCFTVYKEKISKNCSTRPILQILSLQITVLLS